MPHFFPFIFFPLILRLPVVWKQGFDVGKGVLGGKGTLLTQPGVRSSDSEIRAHEYGNSEPGEFILLQLPVPKRLQHQRGLSSHNSSGLDFGTGQKQRMSSPKRLKELGEQCLPRQIPSPFPGRRRAWNSPPADAEMGWECWNPPGNVCSEGHSLKTSSCPQGCRAQSSPGSLLSSC